MEAPRVIENIKVVPNPIQCPVHRVPTAILKAELCFTTIETVVLSRLSGGLYAHFHDESGVEDDEEILVGACLSDISRTPFSKGEKTVEIKLEVGKKELIFHDTRYISWNTFPERISTSVTNWLISYRIHLNFHFPLYRPTPSSSGSNSPFEVTLNEFAPLLWKSETIDIKVGWPLTFLPYAFHTNFKHCHNVPFTIIDNIKRLSRCPLSLDISVYAAPYISAGTQTRISFNITLSNKKMKLNPTFSKLEIVQFKQSEEIGCWKVDEYKRMPSNMTAFIRDEFGVSDEETEHVFRLTYFYEVEGKDGSFSFNIPTRILSRLSPVVGRIMPSKEINDLIIYHQDTQLARYRQTFVESIMGTPAQKSNNSRFEEMKSWVSSLLTIVQPSVIDDDAKTSESDEGIFTDSGSWVSITSYLLP